MSRRGWLAAGVAGVAGSAALLSRRATRTIAFPPGPDAVTPEGARQRAGELLTAPRLHRRDLAMDFAPAVSTSVDPLLHGRRYFPRMLADIEAAQDHVHLLIYGYKPGDIGTTFRDALAAKVRDGVEVRLAGRCHRQRDRHGQQGAVRRSRRRRHRGRRARWSAGRPGRRAGRPSPGVSSRGYAPLRPPQDGRHRRRGRLRRWQRDRGPLQRRTVLRRDVSCHRDRRGSAPARLPRELALPGWTR